MGLVYFLSKKGLGFAALIVRNSKWMSRIWQVLLKIGGVVSEQAAGTRLLNQSLAYTRSLQIDKWR